MKSGESTFGSNLVDSSGKFSSKAHLRFISTGGTIAGLKSNGPDAGYTSGQISGEQLLPSDLTSGDLQWSFHQPYSIGSQHAHWTHFLALRLAIMDALADPSVDGVLVTHGTDTMEEVLYFLWRTLPSGCLVKPVLFTGAMRPSDHPQADGPSNILSATKVLIHLLAHPVNPVVPVLWLLMDGKLCHALDVSKRHTSSTSAFSHDQTQSVETIFNSDSPSLLFDSEARLSVKVSAYKLGECADQLNLRSGQSGAEVLSILAKKLEAPKLQLLYCHAGMGRHEIESIQANPPDVLLIASFGNGNVPDYLTDNLLCLAKLGVRIVLSSRVVDGGVHSPTEPSELDVLRDSVSKGSDPKNIPDDTPLLTLGGPLSLSQLLIEERLKLLDS